MTDSTEVRLPRIAGLSPSRHSLDLSGASSFWVGKVIVGGGLKSYEPEVFAMMSALIETADASPHLLDIGANIGVFSLAMKAMFGERVKATAFEPMPELAAFVRTAALRNELEIEVLETALGARDETARFFLSSKTDASNSLNERFRAHRAVIDVEVRRLDTLGRNWGSGPFVLKIDTESTEPDVLEGGRGFITQHRPPIICEVLAGRTEEKLWSYFSGLGYVAVHITGTPEWNGVSSLVGDATYTHRDWLFLPGPASPTLKHAFARSYSAYAEQ